MLMLCRIAICVCIKKCNDYYGNCRNFRVVFIFITDHSISVTFYMILDNI